LSLYILIFFGIAALIGLWGLLSLIIAMHQDGGPIPLVGKWIKAVRGKTED